MSEKLQSYIKHETKKQALIRFLLVLLTLLTYLMIVIVKYGLKEGLGVTAITWSFFVFCTPIASAGLLLDFPLRLILKIKMIHTEMFVWLLSFVIALSNILFNPKIFETNLLLKIYHDIITTPYPFWSIIFISGTGTFFSIYFADELVDTVHNRQRDKFAKHKNKHRFVIMLFIISLSIFLYSFLLKQFNINLF